MTVRSETEILRTLPLFLEVSESLLQLISFSADAEVYKPGQVILRKGELCQAAYLIVRGQAQATEGEDLQSVVIQKIGRGALIFDLGMIVDLTSPISIFATTETTVKKITRQLFLKLSEEFPEFGNQIKSGLLKKLDNSLSSLQQASEKIKGINF